VGTVDLKPKEVCHLNQEQQKFIIASNDIVLCDPAAEGKT
jgi:hypothetical protein